MPRLPPDFVRTALHTYNDTVTHARCAPTNRWFAAECRHAFDKRLAMIRRMFDHVEQSEQGTAPDYLSVSVLEYLRDPKLTLAERWTFCFVAVCTWFVHLPLPTRVSIDITSGSVRTEAWIRWLMACIRTGADLNFAVVTPLPYDVKELDCRLQPHTAARHGLVHQLQGNGHYRGIVWSFDYDYALRFSADVLVHVRHNPFGSDFKIVAPTYVQRLTEQLIRKLTRAMTGTPCAEPPAVLEREAER